ncbi:hypothetical protein SAMN05216548_105109 [Faunimonas pinastri]|uniref:DNA repair protein MmcB-related protein n=1 Tax=Faunimonas pinastri TaxID=1855383 RepID=A0A1H9GPS3_9HYPH|nr:MmcB family DNA repair protein [Faunimonas pinastri]SEQ52040.1 hypothetical protein SAMN05216548_105109 [Faunimonas pinastri]
MASRTSVQIITGSQLAVPQRIALPVDGRQSERALAIRRGVCRRLRAEGLATVPEVTLPSGRRADLVALCPKGGVTIIEIKSSIEDFRADNKWPDYLMHSDRFFFATGPHVPPEIFPEEAGLIVADPYGAEIIRGSEERKLAAATRKEMLIRIARAVAHRLHDLEDPEALAGGF